MKELDSIDRKILTELNKNARVPLKELSKEVFLTSPAVSARILKLEQEGYIKGYHAEIDREKLGLDIKAYIMLSVNPTDIGKFHEFIQDNRNVFECCHITGLYSMLIKVGFGDTIQLEAFIIELQKFGKTETQIVFHTLIERI